MSDFGGHRRGLYSRLPRRLRNLTSVPQSILGKGLFSSWQIVVQFVQCFRTDINRQLKNLKA